MIANLKEAGGNYGAYEQELYTRRDDVGDVGKQTEARYCIKTHHLNTEVTSIESELSYHGRSAGNLATWIFTCVPDCVGAKIHIILKEIVFTCFSKRITS